MLRAPVLGTRPCGCTNGSPGGREEPAGFPGLWLPHFTQPPPANRMAPALPFTLRVPRVSSTPGPGVLPGSHPVSPSTRAVHGTTGSCPLRAHPILPDHIPGTCTPEFSAQIAPSSLPGSTRASSREFSPKPPPHWPGGGGPSSSWGGQRSDMGLEYPHMCTQHAHCAGQSWRERRRGGQEPCSKSKENVSLKVLKHKTFPFSHGPFSVLACRGVFICCLLSRSFRHGDCR